MVVLSLFVNQFASAKLKSKASSSNRTNNDIICETLRWVVGRKASLKSLMNDFREIPREQLIRMSWGELLENRSDSLAMPMLHYLANTTENASARGYFLAIGYLVLPDMTPSEAIQKWPSRVPAHKSVLTAVQLCSFYRKATDLRNQASL